MKQKVELLSALHQPLPEGRNDVKKLYLSDVEDGQPVQKDLFNSQGLVLVKKGTVMTTRLRKQLTQNKVEYLMLDITGYEGVSDYYTHLDDQVIQQIESVKKAYTDSFFSLSSEFENVKKNRNLDKAVLNETAQELINSLDSHQQVYMGLEGIRKKDFYTYVHSVDVAIFMIVLGKTLKFEEKELEQAALAGLLHDIGKTRINDDILMKPGKLTEDEMDIMRQHSAIGAEMLKREMGYTPDIYSAALEHHERVDAAGYPQRIDWSCIHRFSRMASICDLFDAITSERPYKSAMLPHEAVEFMMTIMDSHIDRTLATWFIQNIAVYPLGTQVVLNNGETGIVVRLHEGYPARPVLKVPEKGLVRDLMQERTLLIREVIYPDQQQVETHGFLRPREGE